MTHLAPGIYADIPDTDYHADTLTAQPALSNSIAKLLLRSPLHAWTAHPRLNPHFERKDSKVFDLGRAAHRAALGKGSDYAAIPEDYLSSNGAASTKLAKDFIATSREQGLTPLKSEEVDQIGAMAEKLRARLAEYGITLDPARSEMTAIAEIDGVPCKCRVDNAPAAAMRIPGIPMPRKVLIDLKTIEDASPDAARRAVENYGYDFQGAFYPEVWKAACGEDRDMIFAFIEKLPPHEVAVVHLLNEPGHSGDWFEDARAKTAAARALWKECSTTNRWPGYPNGIITLEARPFFRQSWQDRAAMLCQTSKPTAAALRAAYAAQAPHRIAGE
ncbi:PD-(D/E)XK nuclease-like domain-containing protein [Roseinatronobacter alkalisoli]|uniref:PD-(D/E)XK nuclease-like domain-containing protein n=1 Tax=Roseinatronobacter alkalisoli TaxID=3028235 RepID=A0ABT5TEZ5_9RHOB|nr:PD-(D/E)XK nuclease-like domain-containing protein [Roseinatronobacter sp. HJB301]MDD7972483.1 PD-(D/E)XK nuclease-like domain-containing protein [Roseinatronobacter sp. HJB301]